MSDKSRIFSLFEEFSEEQRTALNSNSGLNGNALLIDGMNTFMRVWTMYPTTNDNGEIGFGQMSTSMTITEKNNHTRLLLLLGIGLLLGCSLLGCGPSLEIQNLFGISIDKPLLIGRINSL